MISFEPSAFDNMTHRTEDELLPPQVKDEPTSSLEPPLNSSDEWEELMGKDILMKTVESNPEGQPIQPKDAVVIDFFGRYSTDISQEDGPIFHEARDWMIVVAEKDVVPVLELCIRFMHVGETALVWGHSKFAYGPLERQYGDFKLPPHSNVMYQVTVKSVLTEADLDDPLNQVRLSQSRKEIGNDAYQNEWCSGQGLSKVLRLYKRGAESLEYLVQTEQDDALRQEAKTVMMDCLNNVAAAYMRAKEYHKAKEAAVVALVHDPTNVKALLRAAKAALLDPASSYEEVQAAIDAAAQQVAEDNEDLCKLRAECKKRKQEYKRRNKEMFGKIGQTKQSADLKQETKEKPALEKETEEATDKVIESENTESIMNAEGHAESGQMWRKLFRQLAINLFTTLVVFFAAKFFREPKTNIESTRGDTTHTKGEF